MRDNSKLMAIILVILAIGVISVSLISVIIKGINKKEEINIVTNYSKFYTVNSCLYRVINYISSENEKSLLLVLSDKYKKNNNINKSNVMNFFDKIEEGYTFISKKMYYSKLNNNITKYYVYGSIENDRLYGNDTLDAKDVYFIVYLDLNNKTFSVEPYSGKIFIGGELDE